jgi:hypothetical protein
MNNLVLIPMLCLFMLFMFKFFLKLLRVVIGNEPIATHFMVLSHVLV